MEVLIYLITLVISVAALIAFFLLCSRVKAIKNILLVAYDLEESDGTFTQKMHSKNETGTLPADADFNIWFNYFGRDIERCRHLIGKMPPPQQQQWLTMLEEAAAKEMRKEV